MARYYAYVNQQSVSSSGAGTQTNPCTTEGQIAALARPELTLRVAGTFYGRLPSAIFSFPGLEIEPWSSTKPVFDGSSPAGTWAFDASLGVWISDQTFEWVANGAGSRLPGNLTLSGEPAAFVRWRSSRLNTAAAMQARTLAAAFDPLTRRFLLRSDSDPNFSTVRVSTWTAAAVAASQGAPVEGVELTDLVFQQYSGSALRLGNLPGLRVANCQFRMIGGLPMNSAGTAYLGDALVLLGGCNQALIETNDFFDTHTSAVWVAASNAAGDPLASQSGVQVVGNNIVRHSDVGVRIGASAPSGQTIAGTVLDGNSIVGGSRGQFADSAGLHYSIHERSDSDGSGSSLVDGLTVIRNKTRNADAAVVLQPLGRGGKRSVVGNSLLSEDTAGQKSTGVLVVNDSSLGASTSVLLDVHANTIRNFDRAINIRGGQPVTAVARYNTLLKNATTYMLEGGGKSLRVSNSTIEATSLVVSGSTVTSDGGLYISQATTLGFTLAGSDQNNQAATGLLAPDYRPAAGASILSGGPTGFAGLVLDINGAAFSTNAASRCAYVSGVSAGASGPTYKVLVVGDSLFRGNDILSFSPRGRLHTRLMEAGFRVDFVGPENTPSPGGNDPHHACYVGATIGPDATGNTIYGRIEALMALAPDVVVLNVGTQNILGVGSGASNIGFEYRTLVNQILALAPEVRVVMVVPHAGMQ